MITGYRNFRYTIIHTVISYLNKQVVYSLNNWLFKFLDFIFKDLVSVSVNVLENNKR